MDAGIRWPNRRALSAGPSKSRRTPATEHRGGTGGQPPAATSASRRGPHSSREDTSRPNTDGGRDEKAESSLYPLAGAEQSDHRGILRALASSKLESLFASHLRAANLPVPVPEYRFHPTRRWRFDFAWPQVRLAVEIDGATWAGGRHTRGAGFSSDCDKMNAAILLGWRVLRFTGQHVRSGEALCVTEQAIANPPHEIVRP